MNEFEKRKQAINRHLAGENVSKIVQSLGKSRQWFYNWLDRYTTSNGQVDWYLDQSKAPKTKPSKISASMEAKVLEARKYLEQQRMAQTGAIAISYELRRQGIEPPPVWTINRIIARHGLNKIEPRRKAKVAYPELFIHTHQMDLVGPRWIKGDGRFYSVNMMDICSRSCYVEPIRTKASVEIAQCIADFWASHGLPDALQMDNELAFRGSNRYPRSFGVVVRFALALGVAPVFIPVKEPWRNQFVEQFNHTYDKRFLRVHSFKDFDQLKRGSREFRDFHNASHRYSVLNQKTPNQKHREYGPYTYYDHSIDLEQKIPLEEGSIYFIRFIRSDCKLHLPTESFTVHNSLKYSYVVAEISVENHCLLLQQNNEVVQTIEYTMPVDW